MYQNFCASIQSSSSRNAVILCLSYTTFIQCTLMARYIMTTVFNIGIVTHWGEEKMVRSLSVVYCTVNVHFVLLKEGFSGGSVSFCQGYALWEWWILTGEELVGLSAWGACFSMCGGVMCVKLCLFVLCLYVCGSELYTIILHMYYYK